MSASESDIGDGIIPEKLPQHIVPSKSEFLPWHKVRKQFIRRYQWNELVNRAIERRWRSGHKKLSSVGGQPPQRMQVANPLRCLLIPGDHLLDVRSLCNAVSPSGCIIRYLGFNEAHGSDETGTDIHVSNNAVTSRDEVVPDSHILRDSFMAIANCKSQAYKYLQEYGPYHVVNLDLCGSMCPNTATSVDPYYTALQQLLVYQFAAQTSPWLLFITTMIEPAAVDAVQMHSLCKPTRENFTANAEFAAKLKELIPDTALQNSVGTMNLAGFSEDQLIRLFGVALGKWLLRLGRNASPEWTVGMRRSFRYSINKAKGAVMLSLAFEMMPNFSPPIDTTGMSKLHVPASTFPSEAQCALKLAKSVAAIRDVDFLLSEYPHIKANVLDESADLMESAGFNRAEYIKWVEHGEPGISG